MIQNHGSTWGFMNDPKLMVKKARELSSLRYEISKLQAKADKLRDEFLEYGDLEDQAAGIAVKIARSKVRRLAPLERFLRAYSETELRHNGVLTDVWLDRVVVKAI